MSHHHHKCGGAVPWHPAPRQRKTLVQEGLAAHVRHLLLVLHALKREPRHVEGVGELLHLGLEVLNVLVVHQALVEVLEELAVLLLDVQADGHRLVEELSNLLKVLLH